MKRAEYKSTFHIYVIFFVLLIGTLAAGFGMVVYNISFKNRTGMLHSANGQSILQRIFPRISTLLTISPVSSNPV